MRLPPHEIRADDSPIIDMPSPEFVAVQEKPGIQRLQKVSFFALLGLLMWAPLAFGSTEPWSQFILRTVSLSLFGFWAAQQYQRDEVRLFPNAISWPGVSFIGLVLVQVLTGSTAYPYATVTESLNLMVYAALMLVAGELFDHRRTLKTFALGMAVFGSVLALFALVQGFSGTDKLYWIWPVEAISAAIYGPYVNHNHYAGLMEMLIPLAVGVAFLEYGSKRILLLFAAAVMALTVVFSRSRGGMISLAAELVFVCAMLFRTQRSRRGIATVFGAMAMIAVLVFSLGSDKMFERFSETHDQYRVQIYRDSLKMAMQKPIIGYGLGTFSTVYPAHRSFYTDLLVNHAHNDYLETLVDTGTIGLGLLVWFIAGVYSSGWKKAANANDHEGRTLTVAALTGITGIVVHSLLDFNLHIPANAALFFVLCAAVATPFKRAIRAPEFRPWTAEFEDEPEDDQTL
jgi:O-antigen ligase